MAHAYFVLREAGQPDRVLLWDTRTISIGRAPGNDLVVADDEISRKHALLEKKDDRFVVGDYRTGNGTLLNGKRVDQSAEIRAGDVIGVGKLELHFVVAPAHPATLGLKVDYASHLKTVGMIPKGADGDRTMLSLTDEAASAEDDFVVEPERSSGVHAFRAGGKEESDYQVRDLDDSLDQMELELASDGVPLTDSFEPLDGPAPAPPKPSADVTRSRPPQPAARPAPPPAAKPAAPPMARPPAQPVARPAAPPAARPGPATPSGDTTRSRPPAAGPAPAAAAADPTTRLRKLKGALDEGLITETEYQAKRARILDEM
jgi:hypothetical protein